MASARHSYVRFFPSDWTAGTARMPRLHKSVYFDICVYNWDMNAPVPPGELALMVADVAEGPAIVESLIAAGKLVRCEDGCVANPRAMAEARHSFEVWEKKSRGGKIRAEARWSGKEADSSPDRSATSSLDAALHSKTPKSDSTPNAEPEPEPEPVITYGAAQKRVTAKKGSRLADDWTPSEADVAFAKEKGMDANAIAETACEFRDHWHSAPGQKGVKLDWPATWRNWVRREVKTGARAVKFRSATGHAYRGTIDEVISQAARRHDQDTLSRARAAKKRQGSEDATPIGAIAATIAGRMAHG